MKQVYTDIVGKFPEHLTRRFQQRCERRGIPYDVLEKTKVRKLEGGIDQRPVQYATFAGGRNHFLYLLTESGKMWIEWYIEDNPN